ncbi:MAG: oligosaccharide flippase family protein [Clostridia bacterium]|nr:oligosaccharide flippase family protein [Clostridia bacterium]
MNRSRNSLRNIIVGMGGQLLNIIMSFAYRTVFIHSLSDEYLGINGVFTNILMVFSLADLGVGTAIIYALYKPIAENDVKQIKALMKMYAKAYITIGFVILGMGLVCMPFIQHLITTDKDIPHLKLIFMIFVINTASTYFFAYKGTLLTASQQHYLVSGVVYGTSVICYLIQIVVMLLTHNYILTLSIQVGTNILQNIITAAIADRKFPYLKGKNEEKLSDREKKGIFKNMSSLMFYRTGQVIINGTDSIIISKFQGVVEAGFYSNYSLITTTIKNLLLQVFHAITGSIGNLAAVESDAKKYRTYNLIYFGNFWMFGFCSVCLFVLLNPFVTIWAGKDRVLTLAQVFFIVLNFYLVGMRNVNLTFRDTMGIFKEGRFIPIISAAVNIIVSIITTKIFGLIGAFIGTTVSMLTTLVWMEPVILFKYGFKRNVMDYFVKYVMYFGATVLATVITYFIASIFPEGRILYFLGKLIVCAIVPNVVFFALFGRTVEFKDLFSRVKNTLGRRFLKKKEAA